MKTISALTLCAAVMLGGCNVASMNPFAAAPKNVRLLETSGEGFGSLLAQEYQNLAVLEEDFRRDPASAAHYAKKAQEAARGGVVWPDDPTRAAVDAAEKRELARRYNMVLDALEALSSEENAGLLALAQTRYDCWLQRAAARRDEAEVSICRDMLVKALGMMSVPAQHNVSYTIVYEDDDTILDDAAMQAIETVAQAWRDRSYWEVLVVGHNAAGGNREASKRVSMRRAVAVRNMLAQQGIDPDNVTIISRTAARDEAEAEGRRIEIRFEPVYLMKEGPVYDSLESLGEG